MAGKYAHVIKGLAKKSLSDDPTFQEVVEARKRELVGIAGNATALAAAYVDARNAKERHAELEVPLNVEVAAVEQMLWQAYENANVSSIKSGDRVVAVEQQPYAKVIDPGALRAWAIENGHEGNLSLPWQTVNALAKLAILGEGSMPDGIEVQAQTTTKLRKG
jgi:hypothetical protein